MWDYFKKIMGIGIPNDLYGHRSDNLPDSYYNNNWENNYDDLSDDESVPTMPNNHFFSVFTNPLEMHKFLERQMEEIVKRAFKFNNEIGLTDEEESSPPTTASLRDEFLKPGIKSRLEKDNDLDGQIGTNEFQSFLDGPRLRQRQIQPPSVYSHSVTVRTIRRPDGTVETTRTERDHTGKEVTTITTQQVDRNDNILPVTFNDVFSKLISF